MAARNDGILLAGRLLLASALLPAAIGRALNPSGFALTLAGTGMPYPNAVATASVVIGLFGPLLLVLGVLPRLVGLGLAVHAVVAGLLLHRFWEFAGAGARVEQELFLAQLGLAAGFVLYAVTGPGGWSWQGWWHGGAQGSERAAERAPVRAAAAPPPAAKPPRKRAAPPRGPRPAKAAA
ncbi:DoxX family protein [Methylobacterium indicum]|uniref:DoxX family protein n=2 Tax=Methylobacterium indicum TaxID=1775910 RepID=A0ABR5H3X5_9HYPH|nr:DoxX family membrane protein [Methylobacterium indicum]KMO18371.1 DoxX family protein [Methylobacterium indicum]KTS36907.1 DoxX family protein [Methylobacterium indicum]KTS38543.1 DoxX family protein [Methylobacterium indicum]KTS52246.1 DoxX family protein [Methylobacterium indicum]